MLWEYIEFYLLILFIGFREVCMEEVIRFTGFVMWVGVF